jgi:hypothetical protein
MKTRKNEREVNQLQRRSLARVSGAQQVPSHYVPKEVSSTQRPAREAPNVKDAQNTKGTKIKQTVSAAGIFKKKPKVNPRDKRCHRHRKPTPEPDSFADFQGMVFYVSHRT